MHEAFVGKYKVALIWAHLLRMAEWENGYKGVFVLLGIITFW